MNRLGLFLEFLCLRNKILCVPDWKGRSPVFGRQGLHTSDDACSEKQAARGWSPSICGKAFLRFLFPRANLS
jgi:hypothetical protein